MKAEWEDAGKLAKFYAHFGKSLQIKGWWLMFGRAVCIVRVVPRPAGQGDGET